MVKLLKGDDATHVVEIDLPEAAYADGVQIEFALGDLVVLMPSTPRVALTFPASWTRLQPCGRQLGSFTLISPTGERATVTKTYPVYITDDVTAVGAAGSVSGSVIPAIDFSGIETLDASSTPGDTKAVLNEILRRLKALCITLAVVFTAPLVTRAAAVTWAPLDVIPGNAAVVTNVTFEGLATTSDLATAPFVPLKGVGYTITPFSGGLRVTGGSSGYVDITGDGILTSGIQYFQNNIIFPHLYKRYVFTGESYEYKLNGDESKYYRILFPTPARDDTLALKSEVVTSNDLAAVTSTIPETVTNVVRDVQGLVYDEKLGITWKQTMYDGNLYYVAVTNANITEVK